MMSGGQDALPPCDKFVNVAIFVDAINFADVQLRTVVISRLIELHQVISLSVTVTLFQDLSAVTKLFLFFSVSAYRIKFKLWVIVIYINWIRQMNVLSEGS